MLDLNLKKKETLYKDIEKGVLSDFYKASTNKNKAFRFAMLDNNFSVFLPHLKDGAVKLYLYYALAAYNESGESWHSMDTISKNLGATDRSIGNWNNELEDLGLIYRANCGKKSKTTFVLPLTGFSTKMDWQKINQIFTELNLFAPSEDTRVFGKFQSLTKLYIKAENQKENTISEVICVSLEKVNRVDKREINKVTVFLYNVRLIEDSDLLSKINGEAYSEKVVIVNEKKSVDLGGKIFENSKQEYNCYFINYACKIDDVAINDIMVQLTDDADTSELPKIIV